jgi:hypothetical protein
MQILAVKMNTDFSDRTYLKGFPVMPSFPLRPLSFQLLPLILHSSKVVPHLNDVRNCYLETAIFKLTPI